MHMSGEGQTAITIKVLWEVYAQLRLFGYRRPTCPSLGKEEVSKGGGAKLEGREGKEGIRKRRGRGRWGISLIYSI